MTSDACSQLGCHQRSASRVPDPGASGATRISGQSDRRASDRAGLADVTAERRDDSPRGVGVDDAIVRSESNLANLGSVV